MTTLKASVRNRVSPGKGRALAALLLAAFGLPACGGSDGGKPTPVPTPTPAPVRSIVSEGNFTLDAPDDEFSYFYRRAIVTGVPGTLETTVDWTYATNTLWMYIAEGPCSAEQFSNPDCPGATCECRFSVISEENGPKPRILRVPNAAPATRTLIVWNLGPSDEGCSFQSTLTTGGTAVVASSLGDQGFEIARKRRR